MNSAIYIIILAVLLVAIALTYIIRKRQKNLESNESGIGPFESYIQKILNDKIIAVTSIIVFIVLMFVTGHERHGS